MEWAATLDKALRVYLLREFQFLTMRVSRSQILAAWKKKNRESYDQHSAGLEKTFSELDRFHKHANKHKPGDFEQILQIARIWCDQIEKRKAKRL